MTDTWDAVKRWWRAYNWHAVLALSNCVLAAGVIGVYISYKEADVALNAQETYNYIHLWNSSVMLRQRRILARALRDFEASGIRRHGPLPTTCELPKNEHGEEILNREYLDGLYRGGNPRRSASSMASTDVAIEQSEFPATGRARRKPVARPI